MSNSLLLPGVIYRKIVKRVNKAMTDRSSDFPIVVHCHLSWDGVWQRPQQFLSRLARKHPVLFVEMHVVEGGGQPFYEHRPAGAPGVTQLKVIFPRAFWGDGDYVDRERRRLVKTALQEPALRQFRRPVQWFYDPMAVVAFAGALDERLIVYDCMDQLSQFRGAPPELIKREQQLLKVADVLFCGGKNLHNDKSRQHSNSFFYGCGVDVEHFAQARARSTPIPADVANLPRPIFGYYGVVDERLDYKLLHQLAQSTRGSVVILGPLAKVAKEELPAHRNLHWLGQRSYDTLPNYAKAFDVCLMPFALNAATEYINPTKALEYLGAGRPVVSTMVPDVVSLFYKVVNIAYSPLEVIAACHDEASGVNAQRRTAGLRLAGANTWERIVAELEDHVQDGLAAVSIGDATGAPVLQGTAAAR